MAGPGAGVVFIHSSIGFVRGADCQSIFSTHDGAHCHPQLHGTSHHRLCPLTYSHSFPLGDSDSYWDFNFLCYPEPKPSPESNTHDHPYRFCNAYVTPNCFTDDHAYPAPLSNAEPQRPRQPSRRDAASAVGNR